MKTGIRQAPQACKTGSSKPASLQSLGSQVQASEAAHTHIGIPPAQQRSPRAPTCFFGQLEHDHRIRYVTTEAEVCLPSSRLPAERSRQKRRGRCSLATPLAWRPSPLTTLNSGRHVPKSQVNSSIICLRPPLPPPTGPDFSGGLNLVGFLRTLKFHLCTSDCMQA